MKRRIASLLLALVFITAIFPVKAEAALSEKVPGFTEENLKITKGDKFMLYIVNRPENVKITWSSSDKAIASVSSKGLITARKAGNTVIKATIRSNMESFDIKCNVTVRANKGDVVQKVNFYRTLVNDTVINDGKEMCIYSLNIPKLKIAGNSKATKKLNKIFSKIKKDEIKMAKTMDSSPDPEDTVALPFYRYYESLFPYHNGNLLSFIGTTYLNTGGIHPSSTICCKVFDLSSGRQVLLRDIFTDEYETVEHISLLIRKKIKAMDDTSFFWTGIEEILTDAIDDTRWYIDGDKMVLIFSPYVLTNGGVGEQIFEIDIEELKNYMNEYGKALLIQ